MNRRSVPASASAGAAGLGRRAAAVGLDVVLALLVGGWLGVLQGVSALDGGSGESATPATWLVVLCGTLSLALVVLQWVLHGRLGWTVGRRALGVRTLDARTHRPIGLARVLLRGLVVAAGTLVAGVGQLVVLLSPLFDRSGRKQGWHDLAARAVVLDVRGGGTGAVAPPPPHPDVVRAASTLSWRAPSSDPVAAVTPPAAPGPVPARPPAPPVAPVGTASAPMTGPITRPLVLAPLAPHRAGPDLDTRALPLVPPPPAPSAAPVPAGGQGAFARLVPDAPAASPAPDVLGHPVPHRFGDDEDVETTRRALPPVPPPSTTRERITAAIVEISDGQRVEVRHTALVGRNPAAATDGVQLVRVVDPGRSVSKTHLQLAVEHSGVWVADRGSTNGTVVTLPDGAQVICPVDQPVRLRLGAVVMFGDCVLRLVETS
ncbi:MULTISPECIES: RDD family protein [Cellulomonas]|uniref:FHA domain-containing protein n=2 Tax=Cellulomonas TaxID=1707 RepID=A0A4Y3KIW6_9CELL|nr:MULTISPECIES: RDD family protein [Cellulomonas]GEA83853.1 hypothetical protein CGE01nite_11040 [Cellulomonas gelida]GGL25577.1 hypothetical protein GCM10009774_15000 [Cellulomonas gelida]